MKSLWDAEPAAILAIISSGIALGVGFGLKVSTEQMALIMAFASAVVGVITRQKVTSPATLQAMTPATLAKAQNTAEPVKNVIDKLP